MAYPGLDRTNPEQNGSCTASLPHLGMRFRCRRGGGSKQGAVPCPMATLSAAPRTRTTLLIVGRLAEEGRVRPRLSGRSPRISEDRPPGKKF
ncbi:hypothetical protein WN55_10612 [Dufourea novaeangliae]|uniref:Uncharacterized protein n=1 Tax=Dufourea novaeangliae TaxID=178035 RepID=A0A154P421_DUFNO|nr:hypothetical protein WN55_10612 [Dufourea novaeangliae]